jgi:hypothetical protein
MISEKFSRKLTLAFFFVKPKRRNKHGRNNLEIACAEVDIFGK